MTRILKMRLEVSILTSLYNSVKGYLDEHNLKPSHLFDEYARTLIRNPKPLPIQPYRRITVFHKREDYKKEFPITRTAFYVNAMTLQELFNVYQPIAYKQYKINREIDTKTIVHTVFYYFAKDNNLDFNEKYFDQEYFERTYTFQHDGNIQAFLKMMNDLGKVPTVKEWRALREQYDGPSEAYIIQTYGTYGRFRDLALKEKEAKERG